MAEELRVEGSIEQEVFLLTVHFDPDLLPKAEAWERLSKALTQRYRETLEAQQKSQQKTITTTSCVVDIQSEIAGSPLVRALFELWKEVVGKEGGQVVCINYPPDYIDSLTSLGLTSLPGFSLASSKDDAFQRVKGKGK